MHFERAPLRDAWTIELDRRGDARGFFARMFCETEFAEAGLETGFAQMNNSASANKGTLRGLHYQLPPHGEVKVMRCIRGAIYDLIADLRPDSATFGKTFGVELTAENRRMIYVPRGFAHSVLSLTDDVEMIYLASAPYAPQAERGLRYDDPWLAIDWPIPPVEVSEKDRNWPLFHRQWHEVERLRGLR